MKTFSNVSGIYKIQSMSKQDRCYIGSSVNIGKRWCTHKTALRINNHYSRKLQRHFNLYGENDLFFSVLLSCSQKDLICQEQIYIDLLNPYFNTCRIAGNTLGVRPSEESKQRNREAQTGKTRSDETRRRMSESLKGNKRNIGKQHSVETRLKMSIVSKGRPAHNKGKPMSEEQKAMISAIKKGIPRSEETKRKLRIANLGNSPTAEIRLKISRAHKGKIPSEETRRKLSESKLGDKHPLFGKHLSEETKLKMSFARKGEKHPNFGKELSEETKRKIGEKSKGRIPSIEARAKRSESMRMFHNLRKQIPGNGEETIYV